MSKVDWKMQLFINKKSSLPLRISILTLFITLLGAFIFSCLYKIDKIIQVEGEIIPLDGEYIVTANLKGQLTNFNLKVGEIVKENQIFSQIKYEHETQENVYSILTKLKKIYDLAVINNRIEELNFTEIGDTELSKLLLNLNSELKKLKVELAKNNDTFINEITYLEKNKQNFRNKLILLKKSKNIQFLGQIKEDLEDNLAKTESEMNNLKINLQKTSENLSIKQINIIKNTYYDVLTYYRNHEIRAPINGVIARVYANDGQLVNPGDKLVSIIKNTHDLGVNIKIPSNKMRNLNTHATVKFAVDAYPFINYDYFTGYISTIDQILSENEVNYSVKSTIIPSNSQLSRYPATEIKLIPGMKVTAYISSEKQTLLEIITEKVFGTLTRKN